MLNLEGFKVTCFFRCQKTKMHSTRLILHQDANNFFTRKAVEGKKTRIKGPSSFSGLIEKVKGFPFFPSHFYVSVKTGPIISRYQSTIWSWDTGVRLLFRKTKIFMQRLVNCVAFFIFSADCRLSLGMQAGKIPDSAVTSSSSYDESVSAPNARWENLFTTLA